MKKTYTIDIISIDENDVVTKVGDYTFEAEPYPSPAIDFTSVPDDMGYATPRAWDYVAKLLGGA